MPRRRLEDRIQDLVAEAIATHREEDLDKVVLQLRAALHEHTLRLRKLAASKLTIIPRTQHAPVIVMPKSETKDVAAD